MLKNSWNIRERKKKNNRMEGQNSLSLSKGAERRNLFVKKSEDDLACFEKLKVGVCGLTEGAGVSFLTLCLAKALANEKKCLPAVTELPWGTLYDSMGMDKRFLDRDFFPFFSSLSKGKPIKGKRNMDEGINWAIAEPKDCTPQSHLEIHEHLFLANHVYGTIVLCDFSLGAAMRGGIGSVSNMRKLLMGMDHVIAVVDPLPSKMLRAFDMLSMLREIESEDRPVTYLINKNNGGIHKREMLSFLKVKNPIYLPFLEPGELYWAEYSCKNPYDVATVRKNLMPVFEELFHRFNT